MNGSMREAERRVEEKREEMVAFLGKHRTPAGEWDLSADDLLEFNRRNDELGVLAKEFEELGRLEKAEAANREALAGMKNAAQPEFPGDGKSAVWSDRNVKSLGQRFVESEAFTGKRGSIGPVSELTGLDVKALMQTSAGWAPETTRIGRVIPDAQEEPVIADWVPMGETTQTAVKYMEETTFTNAAAETAEAGTYPEAALVLTEQTSPVRKVAVFLPITDEQLEDEPMVRDYVDNRLRFMLRQRFSQQIIAGNGVAPNLMGLLNTAGIQTQAKGADPTFDAIYKAMVKIRVTGKAQANVVIVHPNDWQDIRLTRTADGLYILGNPTDPGPERLFGCGVVKACDETENTACVVDTNYVSAFLRRGIDVQITNSHSTYFVEGKQAIRADFRVALVVFRPAAICTVTGI